MAELPQNDEALELEVFSGGANLTNGFLAEVIEALRDRVLELEGTTSPGVYYVDPDAGDDDNDGSLDAPFRSIPGVMDAIADNVKHIQTVYVDGTCDVPADYVFGKVMQGDAGIHFRQKSETWTVVDDNGGLDYDVLSMSGRTVSLDAPGFSVDEHAGFVALVTAGTGVGEWEMIFRNGTDDLTFCQNLPATLDATSKVRIVRQAPTINLLGSAYTNPVAPKGGALQAPTGVNYLFEGLSFTGAAAFEHLSGTILISGCTMTNGTSKSILYYAPSQGMGIVSRTTTGGFKLYKGVGSPGKMVFYQEGSTASIAGLVCNGLEMLGAYLVVMSAVKSTFVDLRDVARLGLTSGFNSGISVEQSVLGAAGNGRPCLRLINTSIESDVSTYDGGTVGIHLDEGSHLTLTVAATGGPGNTYAGAWVERGSSLRWQAAATPTLTNAAANVEISFNDPRDFEDRTWAGGSHVESTKTMAELDAYVPPA